MQSLLELIYPSFKTPIMKAFLKLSFYKSTHMRYITHFVINNDSYSMIIQERITNPFYKLLRTSLSIFVHKVHKYILYYIYYKLSMKIKIHEFRIDAKRSPLILIENSINIL